jgi:hypothetical protein
VNIVDLQTLVVLIVGIMLIGLVWRIIKGLIRFVLTIGILLLIVYILLNVLR